MTRRRFVDKTALITGSGSGIGKAIALYFAREGASTAINDINLENAEKVVEEIKSFNSSTIAVQADVTKMNEVARMVKQTLNKFGKIDILVNNVGLFTPKPFLEMTEESWERGIDINLKSTFLCCKAVIPKMIERKSGVIINMSSGAGKIGYPAAADYVAGKHAVIGLTKSLALEFISHNIRINAVCPGVVNTPMQERFNVDYAKSTGLSVDEIVKAKLSSIPMGRMAEPEEIASVVAFLASEDASYVAGTAIDVWAGR
jgi:NAD(P)-dependent dehydrogenase (short-subunit alcohol dehydrogenase family)